MFRRLEGIKGAPIIREAASASSDQIAGKVLCRRST